MQTNEACFFNATIEIPKKVDIQSYPWLLLFNNNELKYIRYKLAEFEDLFDDIKGKFVFNASRFIKMRNDNEGNISAKLLINASISCDEMFLTTNKKIVSDCKLNNVNAENIHLTKLTMDSISFIREKIICDYLKNNFVLMNNWLRGDNWLTHISINESIQNYFKVQKDDVNQ